MGILRQSAEPSLPGVLILEFATAEISLPEHAWRLRAELLDAIKKHQPQLLLLDCSSLNRMVTLGFSALLSARKLMAPQGGRLALCKVAPLVRESLGHCGMDKLLIIADNVNSVLKSVQGEKT